jgi:cation:H+ antiporter
MPDGVLASLFVLAAVISLGSSWVLVTRIERVGARLGFRDALLGMVAALAADAPEITAAVTAVAGHQSRIGAGVVIGSNVFNLAALLGLSALVAGAIALHRRVIVLEAAVALPVAVLCLVVVLGLIAPTVALVLAAAIIVPYLVLLALRRERLARLRLPRGWTSWLSRAVAEEEMETEAAMPAGQGGRRDVLVAVVAMLIVVGGSVVMERAAATFGSRHRIPEIVVGGLILAGVTSLPNAVAAIYLARRGRGAATLSTAMNSNALNVTVGLLAPASIAGLGVHSGQSTLVAAWYLGLTVFALTSAYLASGLRRPQGALIVGLYLAFVAVLLATA